MTENLQELCFFASFFFKIAGSNMISILSAFNIILVSEEKLSEVFACGSFPSLFRLLICNVGDEVS